MYKWLENKLKNTTKLLKRHTKKNATNLFLFYLYRFRISKIPKTHRKEII